MNNPIFTQLLLDYPFFFKASGDTEYYESIWLFDKEFGDGERWGESGTRRRNSVYKGPRQDRGATAWTWWNSRDGLLFFFEREVDAVKARLLI